LLRINQYYATSKAAPKQIPEASFSQIENLLKRHPDGLSAQETIAGLPDPLPLRTLQYRLKFLVKHDRIEKAGVGRSTKCISKTNIRAMDIPGAEIRPLNNVRVHQLQISNLGREIQAYVNQPRNLREKVAYNRQFLDSYEANGSFYLSEDECDRLATIGSSSIADRQPAGTFAKKIYDRLLIDMSWNSSRLEGNAYSLIDTKLLIENGIEAKGKSILEDTNEFEP